VQSASKVNYPETIASINGNVQIRVCRSSGGLVAYLPSRQPGFEPGSSNVGSVIVRVALGQVSSEYFGFPWQSFIPLLFHNHHHVSFRAVQQTNKRPQYWWARFHSSPPPLPPICSHLNLTANLQPDITEFELCTECEGSYCRYNMKVKGNMLYCTYNSPVI
jgi:hypothetical protein